MKKITITIEKIVSDGVFSNEYKDYVAAHAAKGAELDARNCHGNTRRQAFKKFNAKHKPTKVYAVAPVIEKHAFDVTLGGRAASYRNDMLVRQTHLAVSTGQNVVLVCSKGGKYASLPIVSIESV